MDRSFVINWIIDRFNLNKFQVIALEMLSDEELLEDIYDEGYQAYKELEAYE